MPKAVPNEIRKLIVEAHLENMPINKISEFYNCDRTTVDRIIKRYLETGDYTIMKRGGCIQPKIRNNHIIYIHTLLEKNQNITLCEIKRLLHNKHKLNVSNPTIYRLISNFNFCIVDIPIEYKSENKTKRNIKELEELQSLLIGADANYHRNNNIFIDITHLNFSMMGIDKEQYEPTNKEDKDKLKEIKKDDKWLFIDRKIVNAVVFTSITQNNVFYFEILESERDNQIEQVFLNNFLENLDLTNKPDINIIVPKNIYISPDIITKYAARNKWKIFYIPEKYSSSNPAKKYLKIWIDDIFKKKYANINLLYAAVEITFNQIPISTCDILIKEFIENITC